MPSLSAPKGGRVGESRDGQNSRTPSVHPPFAVYVLLGKTGDLQSNSSAIVSNETCRNPPSGVKCRVGSCGEPAGALTGERGTSSDVDSYIIREIDGKPWARTSGL